MACQWVIGLPTLLKRKSAPTLKFVLIFSAITLPTFMIIQYSKSLNGSHLKSTQEVEERVPVHADVIIASVNEMQKVEIPAPQVSILDERVRVLLIADFRTGSSFTSEIFNQNDDFFYIFEPGRLLMQCMKEEKVPETLFKVRHREMLEKMFQCKFDGLDCYFKEMSRLSKYQRHREIRTLAETCFQVNNTVSCPAVTPQLLEQLCEKKKHIAIKSIRVGSILDIVHLIRNEMSGVNAIQIVRDPRGKLSSWMSLKRGGKTVYGKGDISSGDLAPSNTYCQNSLNNYIVGESMKAEYLQDRYTFVRYEDMAELPLKTTEALYRHLRLSVPYKVEQWLRENTIEKSKENGGDFGTSRLSKHEAQAWRNKLTFEAAETVEQLKSCKDMMRVFGYKKATNAQILANRNITLVQHIPGFNMSQHYSIWKNY
ncbi:carbohydrate sulfotransferase 1-like [Glandiceps talaboti]